MSNFLLKAPECVLIHIPKTGGSTIRKGIWRSNYDGPEFGKIPPEWCHYFKFAFVRHPLERIISAWADFTQLRNFKGDMRAFVKIVIDDNIIYDERRKTIEESIRHHTIPQTHPFNNLQKADFIGRYENYVQDLRHVLRHVGKNVDSIPAHRKTAHGNYEQYLDEETLDVLVSYYDQDFKLLEYERP